MAETLSYCAKLVKEQDPDRFFLTMLMPAQLREHLLSLFAFNYEISKTREVVSETQLGLIRLQWWREAIGKIYDDEAVLEHEVLSALADSIQKHDLSREYFEELIYAREFDLEDVLPAHMDGFISYCDFTNTPLLKLVMQVTGNDPEGEVVQPVAVNYAIAGLMRAVSFHARHRRCYLPQDIMKKHGQSVNKLYELKPDPALRDVVCDCMGYIVPDIRPKNLYLRLSQTLAMMYARQIKGAGYDPFSPKLAIDPSFKALRLFFARIF